MWTSAARASVVTAVSGREVEPAEVEHAGLFKSGVKIAFYFNFSFDSFCIALNLES